MQPKSLEEPLDSSKNSLEALINHSHPLYQLANHIDWDSLNSSLSELYSEDQGRPGNSIRLMVGLHYLKHTYDESDESVLARFMENPYWQYFCGYTYFQHDIPIDSSSMTRFRHRLGPSGIEELLKELLSTAKGSGYLRVHHLNRVNIDTTVQEKAIAFPTDARLYHKMRVTLVRQAKAHGIKLRQSYKRLGKKYLSRQSRYASARQMKRARKMTKKLKTILGCVYRDIERKVSIMDEKLTYFMDLAERLLEQTKNSKNKLYSIHAPEVECIAKGKAHKRYEFGTKVAMATTSKGNWVVSIHAHHGNPYDGHTLSDTIERIENLTGHTPKQAYVDLTYRGHDYKGKTNINIVNFRTIKKLTRSVKAWFKRRAAIEPGFAHLKFDNRMQRNHLKGKDGDQINAILAACGYNMRKLLREFSFCLKFILQLFKKIGREYSTIKITG